MLRDDVHRLLDRAATDLPPSTVNMSVVLRAGRRRRRIVRLAVCLSAVLVPSVVAVCVMAGVPAVGRGASEVMVVSRSGSAVGGAPVVDPVSVAEQEVRTDRSSALVVRRVFDPLSRTLRLGWLPRGILEERWEITPLQQRFTGFESGGRTHGVVVTVLAPGRQFPADGAVLGMARWSVRVAAPVGGGSAVCLTAPGEDGACPVLRWRYDEDTWMSVSYTTRRNTSRAQVAALVRRVAEAASLGPVDLVRLPFWVGGETATYTVLRTSVRLLRGRHGTPAPRGWVAEVVLDDGLDARTSAEPGGTSRERDASGEPGDDPRPETLATGGAGDSRVTIRVGAATTSRVGGEGAPVGSIGGRPAWIAPDGSRVLALLGDVHLSVNARPGRARSVFEDVSLVEDPSTPSRWTDLPIS